RSPGGKTAELLLKRWYALGLRPPNPDAPLVLASASGVSAASAGVAATVGTGAAQAAGAAATGAGSGGLDAAQRAGLIGLLVLLTALGFACWVTLGRTPAVRPATARARRPPP